MTLRQELINQVAPWIGKTVVVGWIEGAAAITKMGTSIPDPNDEDGAHLCLVYEPVAENHWTWISENYTLDKQMNDHDSDRQVCGVDILINNDLKTF